MRQFQQSHRFRIEPEVGAIVIERIDASKQFVVEIDFVVMCRKERRHFFFGFLEFVVRVGIGHVIEDIRHAHKALTRLLHGDERIFESRRLGLIGNRIDFFLLLCHRKFQCRNEVFCSNFIVLRRLIRQRIVVSKGV